MKNLPTKNDVELFISLVMQGVDAWVQAGQLVVKNMESNPDFINEVCDKCPDISAETVERFAQIGRKELYPKLLLSDAPGIRRLRRLPYALQEKFSSQPITVLTADGSTIKADVRNLTPDQSAQVFADNHVRSDAEQRLWLEDQRAKRMVPPTRANLPYRIVGKKLIVVTPCQFTVKELAQVMVEIEK